MCSPSSALKVAAAMLAGGLLATACSSSPSSSTTTTQPPDLKAMLLTAADMPTPGWTVSHSGNSGGVSGCTLPNGKGHALETAETDLQASGGFPEWDEQLANDPPGVAASELSAGVSELNKCSNIKLTNSGQAPISATIAPLSSVPQVGSGAAGWTITASVQGQTVTIFLEATVFGSEGAFFLYGELGTSPTDFDSLVQKAADRITGTTATTGATGTSSTTGTTGTSSTTGTTGGGTSSTTGVTGTSSTTGTTGTSSTTGTTGATSST
jgi:hypothetical protein